MFVYMYKVPLPDRVGLKSRGISQAEKGEHRRSYVWYASPDGANRSPKKIGLLHSQRFDRALSSRPAAVDLGVEED